MLGQVMMNAVKLRTGKWLSPRGMGTTPAKHDGIIRPDDQESGWEFEMPNNTFVQIRHTRMHLPGSSWRIWYSVTDQEHGEFKTYEEALAAFQAEIDAGKY